MERSAGPGPGELARAAEYLARADGPADAATAALLRQYPAAVLWYLVDRGDRRLLAAALRSGFFTPQLARRTAESAASLSVEARLLLTRPELAEAVPPPEPVSPEKPDKQDLREARDRALEESISRWKFAVGSAFPFLRQALSSMETVPDGEVDRFGTDGLAVYYRSGADAAMEEADFHHMLIHCVFRHLPPPYGTNRALWDLSSDMACEYLRAELFPFPGGRELQLAAEDALPADCDPRSAASVYAGLMDLFADELAFLRRRFARDDHRYWYSLPRSRQRRKDAGALGPSDGNAPFDRSGGGQGKAAESPLSGEELARLMEELRQKLAEKWQDADGTLTRRKNAPRRYGLAPGSREEKMILREQGKYDFTRYLRRFSVIREEMQLDQNSFDYIPYYYGLERYGNMPLLEPLETTESCKIEELVIAIDTSGSCTTETVRRFLAETERILMHRENFFRRMNIHIVQCDALIQDDREIRSPEEWKKYVSDLRIRGRGGTNFTPVFTLVEKLQAQGKLKHLKGLLYFTDGDGVYPVKKPPYETAFVFTERAALERRFPEWIVPLCLE